MVIHYTNYILKPIIYNTFSELVTDTPECYPEGIVLLEKSRQTKN